MKCHCRHKLSCRTVAAVGWRVAATALPPQLKQQKVIAVLVSGQTERGRETEGHREEGRFIIPEAADVIAIAETAAGLLLSDTPPPLPPPFEPPEEEEGPGPAAPTACLLCLTVIADTTAAAACAACAVTGPPVSDAEIAPLDVPGGWRGMTVAATVIIALEE